MKLRAVIVTGLTLAAGLSVVEARTATALPAAPASSVASGVTAAGLADTLATPTAYTAAAALPVKGRAPTTGYSRTAFGQAWADTDRNGCDTRNDVLRRDLTRDVIRAGTNGCVLLRGTLQSRRFTLLYLRGGALRGALMVNAARDRRAAAELVKRRTPIAHQRDRLTDPTFKLATLVPAE